MTPSVSDIFNLADHFVDRHLREGRGGKTAISCGDRLVTFAEVAADVNRVGNGLLALGVQEEQRVLILLPDCAEFAAYFGIIKIGAVAVPTNTALRAADYDYFLTESRARVLIVHSTLYSEVAPVLGTQRHLRHVVIVGEPCDGCIGWEEWLRESSPALDAAPTSGDDVAFWLWTSGSTWRAKAAVHSHRDWVICSENYGCGVLGIEAADITFSSSKLFHAYGLGNGLMFPFHSGSTTILFPGKPQATAVLETVERTRPTVFFSVPTLYSAMLQEAERKTYDLGSVRLAVSAAEPLPAEIFRRWHERFGVEILDGIGSTEMLHIYLSAREGSVRPGSTGQAVPGYELRIVDASGNDAPSGSIGDLLVSGASAASCYWNRRALTADRMRGRWFFTGDKYRVDEDGYYWYAGRSDDMFRVSGQWVSSIEVENALIEHGSVLEAAVVAYEEQSLLHTPQAFVVLRAGIAGNAELARELQDFVKGRITPYKYPRRIEFVAELPKSAAGNPDGQVRGIASTFMSTLDVLQRAHAAGRNMIVTHEPTFWSDEDATAPLANDPLYKHKLEFAEKNNLIVWRFHDHWHARKPDGIFAGWNKALGWDKYLPNPDERLYVIPPMTLEAAANHVRDTLKTGSIRVMGDPALKVSRVGRGAHTLAGNMAMLPRVDLLLVSEAREWDSIEYVRDTILAGEKKGMILISHEAGEEAGMDECARWLRTFIPEVPIDFIDSHDPFWRPS